MRYERPQKTPQQQQKMNRSNNNNYCLHTDATVAACRHGFRQYSRQNQQRKKTKFMREVVMVAARPPDPNVCNMQLSFPGVIMSQPKRKKKIFPI